jgi:hypothetical protein
LGCFIALYFNYSIENGEELEMKSFKFMYLTIFLLLTNIGFAASYSCPGENVASIDGASSDQYEKYILHNNTTTKGTNGYSRYWKFSTLIDGEITITQTLNKNIGGYYNHDLRISDNTCGGNNIFNSVQKKNASKTFPVTAGTTYYIQIREHNNKNQLNVDIEFDFTANNITDEITSYSAPSEVTQGETITVTVSYDVSEAREIVTGIQQNHSPWDGWGWTTVTVPAGTGTANISVTIPSDLTLGNGYQIPIVLQPVGGNWNTRLDNKSVNPVNVIAISNRPPIADSKNTTTYKNNPINIMLSGSDPDGDPIYYAIVTGPSYGSLSGSEPSLTYTPSLDYEGNDSFEYQVCEDTHLPNALCTSATVNITIKAVDTISNADDLCYLPPTYEGNCTNTGDCLQTISIINYKTSTLDQAKIGLGINPVSSSYLACGVITDNIACEDNNWTGLPTNEFSGGLTYFPLNFTPDQNHTIYVESNQSGPLFDGTNLYAMYTYDNNIYKGQIKSCQRSYCKKNGLSNGFNMVDPDDGNDDNTYEIYCDNSTTLGRDLIALPLKNDYNNFVFKDDSPQANYYKAADDAKTADANNEFAYLEIKINNDNTISVVPESIAAGSVDNEGYFSNINLIATPFTINWSETNITNCDVSKLRKGADDQAVKINTLDYSKGRCKVESMKLKILSDYKYLKYGDINGGNEVLKETCRQIFETVPDAPGYLPTGSSDGHYWIDPDQGGRGTTDSITTIFRPIVASCQYQADIGEAWTFITALDAKVTNSKNDIHTMDEVRANPAIYYDTCSQLGLLFYVPNTKDTFERVRKYLKQEKSQWINYTGTIREKYKMYTNTPNKEYYIPGEGYNEIWPYGPFGLYFPQKGNHKVDGTYWKWYPGKTNVKGNMSGVCMNSGTLSEAATCTDHNSNMGDLGWRTTLQDMVANGLQGINNGDQFWIADVGAGNYLTKHNGGTPEYSVTGPGQGGTASAHRTPYYEPNGNYSKEAWLNFIADSEGNIYHNDDNNAFYSYYDYMCMAWDNYHVVTRITPIAGPFTAIERNTLNLPADGKLASDLNLSITTQITKKDIDLQIVTFDKDYTDATAVVSKDLNISAGVFLTYITKNGNSDIYNELRYFGDIGKNTSTLSINNNGYHDLTAGEWGGQKRVTTAKRKMQIRFKYCQYNQEDWTTCWGPGNVCKAGCDPENITCNCKYASSDFFAVRPKEFRITGLNADPELLRSARTYTFNTITAIDDLDGNTIDYNQVANNIEQNSTIYLNTGVPDTTSKLHGDTILTQSNNFNFTDGITQGDLNVTYDDVAKLNVELYDEEWASVDSADSPNNCNNDVKPYGRRICSSDTNVTFIPDHFTLTNVNLSDHDQRLTYITYKDDLNMSAPLQVNIKAMNADDDITQNFQQGAEFYENPVEVNLSTIPTLTADGTSIGLNSIKHDIDTQIRLNFGGSDANGTHKISWSKDENKTQQLIFNYNKELNVTRNPFDVNGSDINVTVTSTYPASGTTISGNTADIKGSSLSAGKATFYYAKIRSSKKFYKDVKTLTKQTPILITIYCDLPVLECQAFGIDINKDTDEPNWYLSVKHQQDKGDGNITLRMASHVYEGNGNPLIDAKMYPSGTDITILLLNNAEKNATIGAGAGPTLPMTVGIEIVKKSNTPIAGSTYTDYWLWHNPDSGINLPSPLYKVRFLGPDAAWSGVGDTGHAIDVNMSKAETNRMDW